MPVLFVSVCRGSPRRVRQKKEGGGGVSPWDLTSWKRYAACYSMAGLRFAPWRQAICKHCECDCARLQLRHGYTSLGSDIYRRGSVGPSPCWHGHIERKYAHRIRKLGLFLTGLSSNFLKCFASQVVAVRSTVSDPRISGSMRKNASCQKNL